MQLHIKRFLLIAKLQAVIISGLAVTSAAIYIHCKYEAEFPLTLVATAIIFSIVFSNRGAYKRREAALKRICCHQRLSTCYLRCF
jgi:hypothetical protein